MLDHSTTMSRGRITDADTAIYQAAKTVGRLTGEDHRRMLVDADGALDFIEHLDSLSAIIAEAREAHRRAAFELGY